MSKDKDAYYFSHDSNARNDDKLVAVRMRFGAEGYGIYFMIIEKLREATNYMSVKDYNIIAFDLRVSAEKVKSIIEDFELFNFSENEKKFFSQSLIKRMIPLDNIREQRVNAGKKSAEKRKIEAVKNQEVSKTNPTTVQRPLPKNPTKESKVKEKKVNKKEIYIPENLKISETDKKIFTSANWKPFVQNSKNLEQAIKFSLWFRDKIISDRLTPTKEQIQNWVTDYVILVEKKNKPPKQIAKVCEWAKNDEFWAKQINSASKLLRKDKDGYLYFDVLVSKLEDKKKDETQVVEAVNVL